MRTAWVSKLVKDLKQDHISAMVLDCTGTNKIGVGNPLGLSGSEGETVFVHPVYPDGLIVAAVASRPSGDL